MSTTNRNLAAMPLYRAEDAYRAGTITADQYEGYMLAWAETHPDSPISACWRRRPNDQRVNAIADAILTTAGIAGVTS